MSSLRSQILEVSAAGLVIAASTAAGLAGLCVGLLASRAVSASRPFRPLQKASRPSAPEWTRLTTLEHQLNSTESEMDALRLDYELDTGLLKGEIRELSDRLAAFRGESAETDKSPRQMRFSSLGELTKQDSPSHN